MLKKIYQELAAIRKELQAIRKSLEPKDFCVSLAEGNTDNLVKKDIQVIKVKCGSA